MAYLPFDGSGGTKIFITFNGFETPLINYFIPESKWMNLYYRRCTKSVEQCFQIPKDLDEIIWYLAHFDIGDMRYSV